LRFISDTARANIRQQIIDSLKPISSINELILPYGGLDYPPGTFDHLVNLKAIKNVQVHNISPRLRKIIFSNIIKSKIVEYHRMGWKEDSMYQYPLKFWIHDTDLIHPIHDLPNFVENLDSLLHPDKTTNTIIIDEQNYLAWWEYITGVDNKALDMVFSN
jgi:hypothetical protein